MANCPCILFPLKMLKRSRFAFYTMKYPVYFSGLALSLLAACRDEARTSPPVLPDFKRNTLSLEEGRAVFQAHCASCHHPMKDATGPAMIEVLPARSTGWLDTFFNRRSIFKPDSLHKALVKTYEAVCMEVPLRKTQIEALQYYLGRYPKVQY